MNCLSKLALAMLLGLPLWAGCRAEVSRTSSSLKSVADVKITSGNGKVVEDAPAESAAPAVSNSGTQSAAPAAAPSAASTATTAPAPATASAAASSSAPAADVKTHDGPAKFMGRVTLAGAAPSLPLKLAKGAQTKDAICAENEVPDPRVVVSADGGLANVIVYMAKAPASDIPAAEGEGPSIDQKGCVFLPHVMVCRAGQPIKLLNSDPVAHNVNIQGLSDQFNQILGQGLSADFTFKRSSRLPVFTKCDIHGWMAAYILPLDHPWGAVTDANGNFEIPNLPDGDHEFVVWHEAVGYVERSVKVQVKQGQIVEKSFTVDVAKMKLN